MLDFGFSRTNETWNFTGNALYNHNSNWGSLQILNNYRGRAIVGISNSFRDAETFLATVNYSIAKNLFLTTEAKYNLIADKRIQESNQLKRISGVGGLSGKILETVDFKALLGAENNSQITLNSTGIISKINAGMRNFDIDGYNFNSNLNSELLFLQDKRSSKDVDFLTGIYKVFSRNEMFNFSAGYKLRGRDFLQPSGANNPLAIETNLVDTITGNLNGSWEIFKNYILNYSGSIENITVKRDYMQSYEHINFSKVVRNYHELNTNFELELDIFGKNIFQKIGIIFRDKNERNSIKRKFEIDNNTFLTMQGIESQKDNNSQIVNLFYHNSINFSEKDTIRTNFSITKLEYNTPSIANHDVRDEAKIIGSLWYSRKSSDILTYTVNLYYSQNHLVFIKKERSAQNNWNRIITLNTGIIIHSEVLYYFPRFEVLANYTVYDFETSPTRPRSYSFRQIAYRDTLRLQLSEKYNITNRIITRIYEQGRLFWHSFSELPQLRSIEISASPMLNCEMNKNINFGMGGRFFYLSYGAISANQSMQNPKKTHSISPEASYSIRFGKIVLNCFGWLEFRYQQDKFIGRNPNLFLQTLYRF